MSNSPVIAFLNKMTDLILLNLLFIICCLPVFTIGAAITAMYYVCIISIRQGDGYVVKRFWKSFKENFKQATVIWLIMLVIFAILGMDILFWLSMDTVFAKIMVVLSIVLLILVSLVGMYVFPTLAKLVGNTVTIFKNSLAFSIGYLGYTMVLLLLTGGFIYGNLISLGMNAISMFVGFAVLAYIKSFFIYKVMMNHIDERYDDFYQFDS